MTKRVISVFLCVLCVISSISFIVSAKENKEYTSDNFLSVADGIIAWKKADNGSEPDGYLINDKYLGNAGTTPGDWYPIALGRLGVQDNNEGYLAVIKDRVEERYRESGRLSAAKATEWHRIALAVLAMGGDPTNFGTDENGAPINLIADGTYDRGKTTPLGRQGINGWIWGLITLDSMRYAVPDGAYNTRDDIIVEIISKQLSDGGFALSSDDADPDITAMAITALAPYYNSEKIYSYHRKALSADESKTVREVVDEAVLCLSRLQLDTGDYKSWGTQNVESTDWVAVALCSLNIDPLSDSRFIKNGNTLFDGIMRYRMTDGGFVHSFTYDPDNPTSLPDKSNTMASEQTLYTMASLWRQKNGMRTLFDFRKEQSSALKSRINDLTSDISKIGNKTDKQTLRELLAVFYSLPETERCYVSNYWTLSDEAKKRGIDVSEIAGETAVIVFSDDDANDDAILYFTDSDRAMVDSLPEKLTTEQYVLVVTLLDKLERSEDFDGKDAYLRKLVSAKEQIAAVQAEIDSLNDDIKAELYPFDKITLKDRGKVNKIVKRYNALSEYDRAKIERWEDVVKTKTKLDNIVRAIVISVVLFVLAVGLTVFIIIRIRRRKMKKTLEMEELAAMYKDEDDEMR